MKFRDMHRNRACPQYQVNRLGGGGTAKSRLEGSACSTIETEQIIKTEQSTIS